MPVPNFDIAQSHRYFAVECNNQAWDWLGADDRSSDGTDKAIHIAEASYYHWSQVGTPLNRLRAAYLLANVYAAAGQPENARRALDRCETILANDGHGAEDWDRAFILDAKARATLAAGDEESAEALRRSAGQCGSAIADPECREAFENWFVQW